MTYEEAFKAGVIEGLVRNKLAGLAEMFKVAGPMGTSFAGNAFRSAVGAGLGMAGGLAMRDKDEGVGTTLGRMALMGGVGSIGGYYAKPAWNRWGPGAKPADMPRHMQGAYTQMTRQRALTPEQAATADKIRGSLNNKIKPAPPDVRHMLHHTVQGSY